MIISLLGYESLIEDSKVVVSVTLYLAPESPKTVELALSHTYLGEGSNPSYWWGVRQRVGHYFCYLFVFREILWEFTEKALMAKQLKGSPRRLRGPCSIQKQFNERVALRVKLVIVFL